MAIEAGDIVWTIDANDKPFLGVMDRDSKAAGNLSATFSKHTKTMGLAMTAMGGAITATFTGIVASFVKTGSALNDMSARTGVSVEALSGLKFAAEQSGASLESVESGIKKMQMGLHDAANAVDDAGEATGPFNESLAEIGVRIEDLIGLSPEKQFTTIAQALAGIEDPTTRAALAIEFFGRSGTQLLPMLQDNLAAVAAEGQKLGGWTEESAAAADQLGDSWDKVQASLSGLVVAIAPVIASLVQDMLPTIQSVIEGITAWIGAHPQLASTMTLVVAAVGAVMTVLGPFLLILPGIVTAFGAIIPAVTAVVGVLGTIAGVIAAFVSGPVLLIVAAIAAAVAAIVIYWDELVAAAVASWEFIVGAFNFGIDAVQAAFQFYSDMISNVSQAVVMTFQQMGDGIANVWDWIVGRIQWAADFINSIVLGVINAIQNALNWIAQLPGGVAEFMGFAEGGVVPRFAMGGMVPAFASGGVSPAWVGEKGPELIFMPVGTRVLSHSDSMQAVREGQRDDKRDKKNADDDADSFAIGGVVHRVTMPDISGFEHFASGGVVGGFDTGVAVSKFAAGGAVDSMFLPVGARITPESGATGASESRSQGGANINLGDIVIGSVGASALEDPERTARALMPHIERTLADKLRKAKRTG